MYTWDGPRNIEPELEDEFREKLKNSSIEVKREVGENFFRYYDKVFNYMDFGVRNSKGAMAYFPLPIKFMPWFLFKNDMTKDSEERRVNKVMDFLNDNTYVFSKNYKDYVPSFLWETRKSLLRKSSQRPTKRFTYHVYKEFTDIILNSVSVWAKKNNMSVSQFLYKYITTVNPLMGLAMSKPETGSRKFFVYRNFPQGKDVYDVNVFITVNTMKLTDLGRNLELMDYRGIRSLAYAEYDGKRNHIDGIRQMLGMVTMWKTFSGSNINQMNNKTKYYLDMIN